MRYGTYVRVVGVLILDSPHSREMPGVPASWCMATTSPVCSTISPVRGTPSQENDAAQAWAGETFNGAAWGPGIPTDDIKDPTRWQEVHPVDIISVLPDHPKIDNVVAVAVLAENGLFALGKTEEFDLDIHPPDACPDCTRVIATEFVDQTLTDFSTISEGNSQGNGARIDYYSDHIHLHIKVQGQGWSGKKGKFKAIYRVRWQH